MHAGAQAKIRRELVIHCVQGSRRRAQGLGIRTCWAQAKIRRELVRVHTPATATGSALGADAVHLMVRPAD